MDYEELHIKLQALETDLKNSMRTSQKLLKAIQKDTDNGDLKDLDKTLAALAEITQKQAELTAALQDTASAFDRKSYLENGDFADQMLACCAENDVDVKGEYPVYEMFPYRVKIDAENQDIFIDRKKLSCVRPAFLIQTVKAGQAKLTKASFNPQSFLNELADAYDTAIVRLKYNPERDLYLTRIYKFLAPMSRFRKDYDMQSFAFDLARLYASDTECTKDGRRFQFGHSRDIKKAIRILDANGHEQFLSTIRFFAE